MAFGTAKCKAHPHLTCCIDAVFYGNRPKLFVIRAAFIICWRVAVKSRCDFVFLGCIRQQITRQLQHREAVIRNIGVVGIRDPITPPPNTPAKVFLVAF